MNKKETDRDMFGTPKNRAKSWDSKKSRNPKKDRRKSKEQYKQCGMCGENIYVCHCAE